MRRREIIRFDTPLQLSSPYYFGEGIAGEFAGKLKEQEFDRCYLVTSEKLLGLFGRELLGGLGNADVVTVGEGEDHKGWAALSGLCEELIARGATKDSVLISLGGGAMGNLVGLAAALVFRGIRFVEVPTTIMGQSDSTLSNKQAINGQRGKNHFGVYHAPLFIWADVAYPRSEPARQQRGGVVEGIKNVLISRDTTAEAEPIFEAWQSGDLYTLIHRLIQSKLPILAADPSERKSAVSLEYGHTFGHAIEFLSHGSLSHGEAISIGICLAARLSHRLGYMGEDFLKEHERLLGRRLGTPTRLPRSISPKAVLETMAADNKRTGKGINHLLLRRCGQFVTDDAGEPMVRVDDQIVLDVLCNDLAAPAEVGT
jgi:3-dehydroquinate synthetase